MSYPVIESFENVAKPLNFTISHKATGLPVDLTGYQARLDLRSGSPDSPGSIVLQIRTNGVDPILSVDGPAGRISGVVSAAHLDREDIPAGDYCAQLILEAPGGTTYERGWFVWQHRISSEGRA